MSRNCKTTVRAPFTQNGRRRGVFQAWTFLWLQRQVLVCAV